MALLDELAGTPRLETGGAIATNRFRYQAEWAVGELLARHLDGVRYLFIFEHLEDVIVATPEDAPSDIEFFQVKTKKTGSWTLRALLSRGKAKAGRAPSILGRLCAAGLAIKSLPASLTIVSNAYFRIKLNGGRDATEVELIRARDLSNNEQDVLRSELKSEIGVDSSKVEPLICFRFTSLSLMDPARHTRGKVSEYLDALNKSSAHAKAFHLAIVDEVLRKASYESDTLSTEDFLDHKCIGRSFIESLLGQVEARQAQTPANWNGDALLGDLGYGPFQIRAIRREWAKAQADMLSPTGSVNTWQVAEDVQKCLTSLQQASPTADWKEIIEHVISHSSGFRWRPLVSEDYVIAMTIRAIQEDP